MTQELATQDLPITQDLDRSMTSGELTRQALLIQEILENVMVEGVHYGTIQGTDKPTLYQPGAEKICTTFRLAPKQAVEDMSEPHNNFYRYRVACSLYTIRDGLFVGAAVGEASSAEEKFQWQEAICDEQWEGMDPTRRRIKYFKDSSDTGFGTKRQIQRNAADLANTVLKIAAKRAFISATRGATAASDLLDVDLEDDAVADVAREQRADQAKPSANKPKAKVQAPKFAYGRHKGFQITSEEVPLEYLKWFANSTQQKLADPARAKFKVQDTLFLAALDAEIAHRQAAAPIQPETASKTPDGTAKTGPGDVPGGKAKETTLEECRKPFSDSAWADFIIYCEEEALAHYGTVKAAHLVNSGHDVPAAFRFAFYDQVMALVEKDKK